jgi:DHA1 family tetracycline resistance protein-like MFS transporter
MSEPAELDDKPIVPDSAPAPRGAMLTIFLIVLSDLLGFGVIIPLLPFWARKYDASDFQVGLLFSVYSVCQLIAAPILGILSDRFGRRPVLLFSQIGSVLGFLLMGYATSDTFPFAPWIGLMLVYLSRMIDGASGGNISTAQAYIGDVTTGANRAKGMGMLGAAFGIGFTLGPAIGGLLGNPPHESWPAYAAAAFSGIAAIQTFFFLPESRVHRESEGESLLHPSQFRPILRNGVLVQMLLIFFVSMAAFVMMESTFAMFLADIFGYTARNVGWFFALAGLIIVIVQGGLIGRLTRQVGEWPLVIIGPLLVALAMFLLTRAGVHPLVALLLAAVICNATGRSLQTPALSALISHQAGQEMQGRVFGLFHMLGSLARAVGPVIAAAIYEKYHTGPYFLAAAITFCVAVWTIALRARVHAPAPVTA